MSADLDRRTRRRWGPYRAGADARRSRRRGHERSAWAPTGSWAAVAEAVAASRGRRGARAGPPPDWRGAPAAASTRARWGPCLPGRLAPAGALLLLAVAYHQPLPRVSYWSDQ
jgi:hypothetical protein